jgi:molecular chaperone HtpG
MVSGKLNVQAENIFPIIKKFLYSDHEIFLRELVSNAVDATQKLKTLSAVGDYKAELGDLTIEVILDKDAKTLTIKDKGIGMSKDEVEKYINQIAFSSAEEFVKKYEGQTTANAIIGHFGLGFYSSFMVASNVEMLTKSYKEEFEGVKWTCEGSVDFHLAEHKEKTSRGTELTLFIAEDSSEFLEEDRIQSLLEKYCKFLPVEIKFKDKIINNTKPAWTKKPADLQDEDYKKFYQELYPYSFEEPLFWIHLNVDYPFNLTGILYFPKVKDKLQLQRENKIKLYSNQVYVTDSVEGIVPDFLMLLHGVIDSPDIPLNVSRSYLQSDGNVKKISSYITRKVSERLEQLFKQDRKQFEEKWDDIKIFIQYGMISDEKFYEKACKFALLKNIENKYFTLEEYAEHIKAIQTNKDSKLVYIYATNTVEQYGYIEAAKERGYDILLFDSIVDSHYIGHLERKLENSSFVRIDSNTVDKLINSNDTQPSKLSEDQKNYLKPLVEAIVPKEKFEIIFENMSEKDQPMVITQTEFMRRMKDMSALSGGGMNLGAFYEKFNLIVNTNHPLITKIMLETDAVKQNNMLKQSTDLAFLSQNLLKGKELNDFIKRSLDLIS